MMMTFFLIIYSNTQIDKKNELFHSLLKNMTVYFVSYLIKSPVPYLVFGLTEGLLDLFGPRQIVTCPCLYT